MGIILAQNLGRINGIVYDETTRNPVAGANVWLTGTSIGIATDMDGRFSLDRIEFGVYEIRVSFIGYQSYILSDVEISASQITPIEVYLKTDRIQQDRIEVKQEVRREGDVSRILEQKAAETIVSGISAVEFRKTGDSNAGQVLKRITGVSVVNDKYVYVRGLGERYSNTLLNNVGIPSPEPDRKTIPLNMFSTALIEKINVFKSFSPDLPGSFAGGNVDIRTKSYPDGFNFKTSFGLGSNNNIASARFLQGDGGEWDFFGFDDGTRELPEIVDRENALPSMSQIYFYEIPDDFMPELDILWNPDQPEDYWMNKYYATDQQKKRVKLYRNYLTEIAREFDTGLSFDEQDPKTPISFSVSGGNKWVANGELEYGFFGMFSFKNDYSYTVNKRDLYAKVGDDSLAVDEPLNVSTSAYKTNMGISGSWGVKWRDNIRVDFNSLYTHTSSDEIKYVLGVVYDLDNPMGLLVSQPYQEKSIGTWTLKTQFKDMVRIPYAIHNTLDLLYSSSRSQMYEPDRKDHYYDLNLTDSLESNIQNVDISDLTHGMDVENDVTQYSLMHSAYIDPGYRYFANGWETAKSFGFDYEIEGMIKVKFGLRDDVRERRFRKRIFTYGWYDDNNGYATTIPADLREITSEDSFGMLFDMDNYYYYSETDSAEAGIILLEDDGEINQNAYDSKEVIKAGYAMFTVPLFNEERGNIVFGARNERYTLDLDPYNPVTHNPIMIEKPFMADTTLVFDDAEVDTTLEVMRNVPLVASLDNNDWLPSLAMTVNSGDRSKLRFSASQTVARPQFREIAPYTYIEFQGGQRSVGNIYLKTTEIKNYDIRWEFYPTAAEMISLALFYKDFHNPIEVSLIKQTDDKYYKTWQNAKNAWSQGVEFEIRKKLPILNMDKGASFLNFNFIYTKSEAESDSVVSVYNNGLIETHNSSANLTRPLQGQSDIVLNAGITSQLRSGWDFNLSYNTFSKRLAYLGAGQLEDEYEYPFHSLNFVVGKKIGQLTKVSFKVRNLLDSEHKYGMEDPKDDDEILVTRRWKPGMSMSLSISYDLTH